MTAAERREVVLAAAVSEFGKYGYERASMFEISRRAGISQAYVFRLFGTKKELFRAAVGRCLAETTDAFRRAAAGLEGEEALRAMAASYAEMEGEHHRLAHWLQASSISDDADVLEVARSGFLELVAFVEAIPGVSSEQASAFLACGALHDLFGALGLDRSRPTIGTTVHRRVQRGLGEGAGGPDPGSHEQGLANAAAQEVDVSV
jgi:AcrR family transcriptional regulator